MNRSSKLQITSGLATTNWLLSLKKWPALAVTALLFASLVTGSCDFGQSSNNNQSSYTTLTLGQPNNATLAPGFTWDRFQFTTGAAGTYTIAFSNVVPSAMIVNGGLYNDRTAADAIANTTNQDETEKVQKALDPNVLVGGLTTRTTRIALKASTTYFLLVSGGVSSGSSFSQPGGTYTITVSGP